MLLKLLFGVFKQPSSYRQAYSQRPYGSRRPAKARCQAQSEAHLAILRMGVPIWNHWRVQDPLVRPILVNANLTGMDLENVNLCGADLRGANLSKCYLYDADFQGADLSKANLSRAGLIGANLHKANLSGANLSRAYLAQSDLSQANFFRASLQEADLHLALLTKATLKQATLTKTVMTDCLDLTLTQLQSAQDAHLDFCPQSLEAQLSSTIAVPASESEKYPTDKATDPTQRFQNTTGDRHHAPPKANQQTEQPVRTLCPAI